jgi:hypothetical protein
MGPCIMRTVGESKHSETRVPTPRPALRVPSSSIGVRVLIVILVVGLTLTISPARVSALSGWTGPEVPLPGKSSSLFQVDGQGKQYLISGAMDGGDPQFGGGRVLYSTNRSGTWTTQVLLAPTESIGYGAADYVVTPAGFSYVLYVRESFATGARSLWVRTNRTGSWSSKQVLATMEWALPERVDLAVGGVLAGGGERIHLAWMCGGPNGEPWSLAAQHVCVRSESGTGSWGSTLVTGESNARLSWYPQLAADAAGHVHLLYHSFQANIGYDLMYATNSSGTWTWGHLVWSHVQWLTRNAQGKVCILDEPWNFDIDLGPDGVPQVAWHVHDTDPLPASEGGCGGPKGLFYGKRLASGQWSIVKIRLDGGLVNLAVDALNRPNWLVQMCLPGPCAPYQNPDVFHAVKSGGSWSWMRITGGWANDTDWQDQFSLSFAVDAKVLGMMPWHKPCVFLLGGYTSDPVETEAPWVLYRTCQT